MGGCQAVCKQEGQECIQVGQLTGGGSRWLPGQNASGKGSVYRWDWWLPGRMQAGREAVYVGVIKKLQKW